MKKNVYNNKIIVVGLLYCGFIYFMCYGSNFDAFNNPPENNLLAERNGYTKLLENLKNALSQEYLLSDDQECTRQQIIKIVNGDISTHINAHAAREIKYFNCLYEIMALKNIQSYENLYNFISERDNHISPRHTMRALMVIAQAFIKGIDLQRNYEMGKEFAQSAFNYFKSLAKDDKKNSTMITYAHQAGKIIITLAFRQIFDQNNDLRCNFKDVKSSKEFEDTWNDVCTKMSDIKGHECFDFLEPKNQFDFLFSYALFSLIEEKFYRAALLFSKIIFSFEGIDNFKKNELYSLLEICNVTTFERVKYCAGKLILKEYVQKTFHPKIYKKLLIYKYLPKDL